VDKAAEFSVGNISCTLNSCHQTMSNPAAVASEPRWKRGFHIYTEQAMRNLASRQYKYKGVDLSPTALYILHPYWNFLVSLVPVWIAYVTYRIFFCATHEEY
jgi:hypothetical protein